MIEFFGRRGFETEDLRALRIYPRHDMLDDAVLACRIHRLQDDEQGLGILGVQHVLILGEVLNPFGQ